ncbi:MAG TPA: hypothetical protein ENJ35_06720 [Gammaproteobacteria bacterium]|nr:hypothetical protein [Gammaproteobacteria bacterium]
MMAAGKVFLRLYLILLAAYCQVATASVLRFDSSQERIDVQDYLEWFRGDKASTGVTELLSGASRFEQAPRSAIYPRSSDAYWFRLRLLPIDPLDKLRLLELGFTQLDHLDYYSRVGDGPWRHVRTGDRLPFGSRDIRHRHPVFKVALQAGVVTQVLLRVQSSTSILVPLTLWREDAFFRHSQDQALVSGLYYGVLLALIVYNLFLYPAVRDTAYLWFSLYLGSFALFQFSLDGFAARFFWPDWPLIADRAAIVSLYACMAAGLQFTRHIGRMHRYTRRLDRLFVGLSFVAFMLAGITALVGSGGVFSLVPVFGLLVTLLIPLPLWTAWRRGYQPARFALFAYLPVVPGAIWLAARTVNQIEPSFWSEHLFVLGAAISSILLSFALADKINALRREQAEIQTSLLESERAAGRAQQQFARQLIEAQDNERRRIAVDLHDGVGQNLSFLSNMLARYQRREGVTLPTVITETTQNTIDEVRSISHHLHPHLLDRVGLLAAIEALAEQVTSQTGIRCTASLEDVTALLPNGGDLHLYRIAQEALNNVVRHSAADRVELVLRRKGEAIEFSVTDNGSGVEEGIASSGLGLESIQERARLLGGIVTFGAVVPHCFQLILSLPVEHLS